MPEGPGRLFVVSTPIGNLGDISLRAIETLRKVGIIAAEDTRHTRKLLTHHGISARMVSYHSHNRRARIGQLLQALSQGDVALVTDAGTPVVSDPGQELVHAAASAGHQVLAIPGASALTAAVAVSGIQSDVLHFIGFLPRPRTERQRLLKTMAAWPGALACFEAPHRLLATLDDLHTVFGERQIAVCNELTKLFENVFRGTIPAAIERFTSHPPRGEFTLVVELPGEAPAPAARTETDIDARFGALVAEHGDRKRALAALAAETRMPRKELYARLMSG